MLTCAACGTKNPDDFKFCENCGERIDHIPCPSCAHPNLRDMKFCEECGTRLDQVSCPDCSHLNPNDFKFCEECGATLVRQTTGEESRVTEMIVDKKKPDVRKKEKAVRSKVESPHTSPKPASPTKTISEPEKPPKPTPKSESVPGRRAIRKRPLPKARSQRKSQPLPKLQKLEPKKRSYFKRVVLPLATKAVVRFVVSTITGFLIGKASLLVSALFK